MLVLLLACATPQHQPPTDTAQSPDDTTGLTGAASVDGTTVTFSVPAAGLVEATVVLGDGQSVPLSLEETEFVAVVPLLRPALRYDWVLAATRDDGEQLDSPQEPFTTHAPPSHFPELLFTAAVEGAALEGHMVTSVLSNPSAAVIINDRGEYVWWREASQAGMLPRARLTRDQTAVLFLDPVEKQGKDTTYVLRRVSLDGTTDEVLPSEGIHHDFVELPDRTIAQIRHDVRTVDGTIVKGDAIVEVSAGGEETTVWSVWDHYSYSPDQADTYLDWTHANALDYSETEQSYTVSLCSFSTLYTVDRSGAVLWQLGGGGADFSVPKGLRLFDRQHQFQRTDDGILVFDNRAFTKQSSRVVEYHLDMAAWALEEVWVHQTDPPVYAHGLGDVARLPDGRTRVVWSPQGLIEELAPDGSLRWQLQASLGGGIGYVEWVEGL